jgi:hypothetical protein
MVSISRLSTSVAMATYAGEEYLPEQLASLVRQDRPPDELVVTDDSPTDDTANIVEAFAKTAPFPVRLQRNPTRLGSNRNFERAASLCSGDLILFADQDDSWLPHHISRLAQEFERDPTLAVAASNSTYVDDDLNPRGVDLWSSERFTPADARRARAGFRGWVRHRAVAGHGMAFRANLRPLILPFAHGWVYDQWVALTCAAAGRGTFIPEPLTLHRQHPKQTVGNDARSVKDWYAEAPTLGSNHFQNQLAMWSALEQRLRSHRALLADPTAPEIVAGKIMFLEDRQHIRLGGKLPRIAGACRLLFRGDYHRHGRGLLTFGRDALG